MSTLKNRNITPTKHWFYAFFTATAPKFKGKSKASSKGKGKQLKKKSEKVEDETDIIFDDDGTCCICGKCQPPGLNLKQSLNIVVWAQCDNCDSWVHLEYCSPITSVSENDKFRCKNCKIQWKQVDL